MPKYAGAAVGGKPKPPTVALNQVAKAFVPPAKKPPKRKFASKPGSATAYGKG